MLKNNTDVFELSTTEDTQEVNNKIYKLCTKYSDEPNRK